MAEQTKRQKLETMRTELELERSTFLADWRQISDYLLPRKAQFTLSDTNKGGRRNDKIIDSTGCYALRTMRSGLMSGVTSPARRWFELATPDPNLTKFPPVKEWLYHVAEIMSEIYTGCNLYNVLPAVYSDMGAFATGAVYMEEDFEDVVRFYHFPVGSYCIATDPRRKVNTFYREFRYTVAQVIARFGRDEKDGPIQWDRISTHVKALWEAGQRQEWIDIRHFIYPNDDYDPKKMESKFKRYSSCYYESGSSGASNSNYMQGSDDGKYLRESGYDFFPVLCPRWEVVGEDVYGTNCPGLEALGDIKALQTMQRRKAQAVEKMVNPPMKASPEYKTARLSILPGDISYLAERDGQKGFSPVHEVNPRVAELTADIQDTRELIRRAFYEDLFLMMAQSDRREITAREIDERREEKLLALGPVLEQLNQDLLDPLIFNTFAIMLRRKGLVPEAPRELQGQPLTVNYVSIMHQAQKLIASGSVERFTGYVTNLVINTKDPTILDRVDTDKLIETYGEILNVPPGIVRSDEDVQGIKQGRAKAQERQAAVEQAQQASQAAKNLSQSEISPGQNALQALLQQGQAGNPLPIQ